MEITRAMEITAKTPARRGRGARRAEEKEARADYIRYLKELGPRPHESSLAFAKRVALVRGARAFWLDVWRRAGGNRVDAAALAGIPPNNTAFELRSVGLTQELLTDALLGRVVLDPEDDR